jgi:hypothetical protein
MTSLCKSLMVCAVPEKRIIRPAHGLDVIYLFAGMAASARAQDVFRMCQEPFAIRAPTGAISPRRAATTPLIRESPALSVFLFLAGLMCLTAGTRTPRQLAAAGMPARPKRTNGHSRPPESGARTPDRSFFARPLCLCGLAKNAETGLPAAFHEAGSADRRATSRGSLQHGKGGKIVFFRRA